MRQNKYFVNIIAFVIIIFCRCFVFSQTTTQTYIYEEEGKTEYTDISSGEYLFMVKKINEWDNIGDIPINIPTNMKGVIKIQKLGDIQSIAGFTITNGNKSGTIEFKWNKISSVSRFMLLQRCYNNSTGEYYFWPLMGFRKDQSLYIWTGASPEWKYCFKLAALIGDYSIDSKTENNIITFTITKPGFGFSPEIWITTPKW